MLITKYFGEYLGLSKDDKVNLQVSAYLHDIGKIEIPEELLNKKENSAEDTQTHKPTRKYAVGDIRIFYNSLSKLVTTLQSAGINAQTKRYETPQYVEIKVLINKSEQPNDDKQIVNSI